MPSPRAAAAALQRPLVPRFSFWAQPSASVEMMCMAHACANRTCQTRLLAQALSQSSAF
jgi:hypothetical protein